MRVLPVWLRFVVLPQLLVSLSKRMEFSWPHIFKVEQRLVRPLGSAQQFVKFDVQLVAITVLGILDEEHHQECDDRGRSIDDQLPRVVEMKQGPAYAQAMIRIKAITKVNGRPLWLASHCANRSNFKAEPPSWYTSVEPRHAVEDRNTGKVPFLHGHPLVNRTEQSGPGTCRYCYIQERRDLW